eukprot:gene8144-785_t
MPKWTEQQQMELLGSGSGSGSSNSTTPPRGHGGSNRSLVNRSTRSDTHASTTTTSNNPCRTTDHLNRERINISSSRVQTQFNYTSTRNGSSSPASLAQRRAGRSKSEINRNHVTEAVFRHKMSRAEKRERNKTIMGVEVQSISENENSQSQLTKELEMRRDIMQLQKEHILQLQAEIKQYKEENLILIHTLGYLPLKLAASKFLVALVAEEVLIVTAFEFHAVSRYHQCSDEEVLAEAERERDEALRKVASLLHLVEDLSKAHQVASPEGVVTSSVAVLNALALNGEDKFNALEGVHARLISRLSVEDLDREVLKQNQFLDSYLDSNTPQDNITNSSMTEAIYHLSSLRRRLRPKLRDLLRTSNDARIRSTALGTSEPSSPNTSANSSLDSSSLRRIINTPTQTASFQRTFSSPSRSHYTTSTASSKRRTLSTSNNGSLHSKPRPHTADAVTHARAPRHFYY